MRLPDTHKIPNVATTKLKASDCSGQVFGQRDKSLTPSLPRYMPRSGRTKDKRNSECIGRKIWLPIRKYTILRLMVVCISLYS